MTHDTTNWLIDGSEETMDSRDIIARIEELGYARAPWIAGYNMPGFMPDSEPCGFSSFDDAREYIVSEMKREIDQYDDAESDVITDLEGAIVRLGEVQCDETEYGETIGKWHYWITYDANAGLKPEELEELEALKALVSEAESSPDWNYGETLIRDDYFVRYTEDLIADCYPEVSKALESSQWPMTCLKLDYKQAARDLKVDYMPVTFNGITFWIRG